MDRIVTQCLSQLHSSGKKQQDGVDLPDVCYQFETEWGQVVNYMQPVSKNELR